jgi:hypothetical protein
VGRGIRLGLKRCPVCGGAHDEAGQLCDRCTALVAAGDREALVARSIEFISGRFGEHYKKKPDWYREVAAKSIERTYFASTT